MHQQPPSRFVVGKIVSLGEGRVVLAPYPQPKPPNHEAIANFLKALKAHRQWPSDETTEALFKAMDQIETE